VALAGLVAIAILGASTSIWPQLLYMFAWSNTQATAISIFRLLALTAGLFAGGTLLPRRSPRTLVTVAGVLYGLGTLGAGTVMTGPAAGLLLFLVFVGLAGFGTGLGFAAVIATALLWFPDRRGMFAGLTFAALVIGALPGQLLSYNIGLRSLMLIGLLALVAIPLSARVLRRPVGVRVGQLPGAVSRTALWGLLFLNTLAGAFVTGSVFAGMGAQGLVRTRYAFAFILCLGLGALVLGTLSDRLGRRRVLLPAMGAQLLILLAVPLMFSAAIPLLLLFMFVSGGGFSITSAIMADSVGAAELGPAFGPLLTAWSLAFLVTGAVAGLVRERGVPFLLGALLPLIAGVIASRLPAARPASS
jgi:MFS family permease